MEYPTRPSREWLQRYLEGTISMAQAIAETSREGEKVNIIEFYVEVAKVQTMADGGVRVVLDLGEDGRKVMEALTECKQNGMVLDVKAEKRE